MATDDEVVRLILQLRGQDEARDLARAVGDLRTKIVEAMHAHSDFNDALKDPAIRQDIAQLKEYEAQLGRVNQALGQSHSKIANSGQAMIQWSRAIQDFQAAGFPGIVNNLELMASSIGAPAFVAGLATLAGVFGPPLVRGIADAVSGLLGFADAADKGATAVEKIKAQIEAIEKKPVKLAIDLLELDNAKKALKELEAGATAYQAALHGKSGAEVRSGQAIKEMFAEGLMPGERRTLVEDTKAVDFKERMALDEPLRQQREEVAKLEEANRLLMSAPVGFEGDVEIMEANRKRIEALKDKIQQRKLEIQKQSEKAVGEAWTEAESGGEDDQEKLRKLLEKAGRPDLAEGIKQRAPGLVDDFTEKMDPEKSGKALAGELKKKRQDEARQRQQDQQEIDKLAGTFTAGPLADKFFGGAQLTPADVKAELEKTLPEQTAARIAAAVTQALMAALVDKVAKRVAETGDSTEQAKKDLADETKGAREAAKAAKEAAKEDKAGAREADKMAKFGMTQAQADAAYAMLTGEDPMDRSPDSVREEMAKHAKEQDKAKDDATKKAQQAGRQAGGGAMSASMQMAILQGGDVAALGKQAGRMMAGRGLVSQDMAGVAGAAAADEANKKLNEKVVGLQSQGLDAMTIQSTLLAELVAEVERQNAALRRIQQQDQASMNRMRTIQRSRMNGHRN